MPPTVWPLSIIRSTRINFLQLSYIGTHTDVGLATWDDLSGNGRHDTQGGAGTLQPAINTGGPGGKPYVTPDGVDDFMFNPFIPAGTGWLWMLARRKNATANAVLINASSVGNVNFTIRQTGSPNIQMRNTAVGNSAACAVGTWFEIWAHFTGSTADELKVGSALPVTGANASNAGGVGGMYLGSAGGLSNFCSFDLIGKMHADTKPTADERAELSRWVTAEFAGGIQV
ncbi:MAG TPA: hypothetical protein VG734_25830 [Lacunisphaera sp.]|nr:hypothetical protein [Lacunisphaera sp.]